MPRLTDPRVFWALGVLSLATVLAAILSRPSGAFTTAAQASGFTLTASPSSMTSQTFSISAQNPQAVMVTGSFGCGGFFCVSAEVGFVNVGYSSGAPGGWSWAGRNPNGTVTNGSLLTTSPGVAMLTFTDGTTLITGPSAGQLTLQQPAGAFTHRLTRLY